MDFLSTHPYVCHPEGLQKKRFEIIFVQRLLCTPARNSPSSHQQALILLDIIETGFDRFESALAQKYENTHIVKIINLCS